MKRPADKPEDSGNELARTPSNTAKETQQKSHDRIYQSIMRGGGAPFGRPFDVGLSTLTERVVRAFKQLGFFGFETLDAKPKTRKRNKFTRYGAGRYRGDHKKKP